MHKKKNLQRFLIQNFIIILLVVSGFESIIWMLLNRYIMPLLQVYGQIFASQGNDFGTAEFIYLLVYFLVIMLLAGLQSIVPNVVGQNILHLKENFEAFSASYMGINSLENSAKTNLTPQSQLLLYAILIVVTVCIVAPYLIGAFIYARLVIREVNALQKEREQEKQLFDRRRNLMLSDVAHDLRTPITTIYGYAKALHDGMVSDEKQEEYLMAIQNKSQRMSELIQLLFDYVKLDSDQFSLDKKPIDLAETLRSNAAMLFTDFEEKHMEFEADIPEEVCMYTGDPVQLSRAFTNLLTNAMRHNDEGTKVFLKMIMEHEKIMILVADTGSEISPEMQKKLFEPFAMGDDSRNSKGGSGLGLSIASKIIEMHGGTLTLNTSFPGYTKAFVIQLFCR